MISESFVGIWPNYLGGAMVACLSLVKSVHLSFKCNIQTSLSDKCKHVDSLVLLCTKYSIESD